jgi:hypothetical protein
MRPNPKIDPTVEVFVDGYLDGRFSIDGFIGFCEMSGLEPGENWLKLNYLRDELNRRGLGEHFFEGYFAAKFKTRLNVHHRDLWTDPDNGPPGLRWIKQPEEGTAYFSEFDNSLYVFVEGEGWLPLSGEGLVGGENVEVFGNRISYVAGPGFVRDEIEMVEKENAVSTTSNTKER